MAANSCLPTDKKEIVMHARTLRAASMYTFVAILSLIAAQPVASQTNLAVCTGTASETFDPPLTYTAQETDFTGDGEFTCTIHPTGIDGGSFHVEGTLTFNCNAAGAYPQELTIVWSDESESEVLFTTVDVNPGLLTQVIIGEGVVQAGRFEDATVMATSTFLNASLASCAFGGLSELSGTFTLAVIEP